MKFKHLKIILLGSIAITIVLFIVDFLIYGSGISGDTSEYLALAGDVYKGRFPSSSSHLPGFPFVIGVTAKLMSLKIYQAAIIWIGLFYVLNLVYLGKIVLYLNKIGWISKTGVYFLFFILISWWSFRIQKATHADAMYFSLLIIFTYYLIKSFQENKSKYFLILGLILAIMSITKYNSYVFLPIVAFVLVVNKIDYKQKIINLFYTLSPSLILIAFWKLMNGGFIYSLSVNHYERTSHTVYDVFRILYVNVSDFGKIVVGLLFNPVFGRWLINVDFGFLLGLAIIMLLFFLIYKFRKNQFKMMLLVFATGYLISMVLLQSLNLVTEINIRTLITFVFFGYLLIGIYIIKHKLKILGAALIVILLCDNVLIGRKWLTETSKNNNFKHEYSTNKERAFKSNYFIKSIENKNVISNMSEPMMFHLNYEKHIKSFKTDRVFYKGKFMTVSGSAMLKQISENLKIFIENNGIVVFSNKLSTNDEIILNNLLANRSYSYKYYDNLIMISKVKQSLVTDHPTSN